jgi:transposase
MLQLHDLSDQEWMLVKPRIPMAQFPSEATNAVIRGSVNGILWRMRTGEPWRLVPSHYGHPTAVFRRFRKWTASGVWEDVTKLLAEMRSKDRRQPTASPLKTWSEHAECLRAGDLIGGHRGSP